MKLTSLLMVASNWACEYRTELYLDKAEMSGGRFAAIYPDPKLARDLEMSAFHIVFNPTGYQHTVRRAIEESSLIRETEQNDGKIPAQTSLARIPLLVTSDKHLLDVDEDSLLHRLQRCGSPSRSSVAS